MDTNSTLAYAHLRTHTCIRTRTDTLHRLSSDLILLHLVLAEVTAQQRLDAHVRGVFARLHRILNALASQGVNEARRVANDLRELLLRDQVMPSNIHRHKKLYLFDPIARIC